MNIHRCLVVDEASTDDGQTEASLCISSGKLTRNRDHIIAHIGAVLQLQIHQTVQATEGFTDFRVNYEAMQLEMRQMGHGADVLPDGVITVGANSMTVPGWSGGNSRLGSVVCK